MGDRYVVSNDNKNIIYMDAINLYGHSMSQMFTYDEIQMWHGHPDRYMNKLEENINTPDDKDIDYFVRVDLKYPDDKTEKKAFHLLLKKNKKLKISIMII